MGADDEESEVKKSLSSVSGATSWSKGSKDSTRTKASGEVPVNRPEEGKEEGDNEEEGASGHQQHVSSKGQVSRSEGVSIVSPLGPSCPSAKNREGEESSSLDAIVATAMMALTEVVGRQAETRGVVGAVIGHLNELEKIRQGGQGGEKKVEGEGGDASKVDSSIIDKVSFAKVDDKAEMESSLHTNIDKEETTNDLLLTKVDNRDRGEANQPKGGDDHEQGCDNQGSDTLIQGGGVCFIGGARGVGKRTVMRGALGYLYERGHLGSIGTV